MSRPTVSTSRGANLVEGFTRKPSLGLVLGQVNVLYRICLAPTVRSTRAPRNIRMPLGRRLMARCLHHAREIGDSGPKIGPGPARVAVVTVGLGKIAGRATGIT